MSRSLPFSKYEVNDDRAFKVATIGDSSVGKSSIITYLVEGHFDLMTHSTIGASFKTKKYLIGDESITLNLWDTAGQERFRSIIPMYIRNADVIILVYDISQPFTLEHIKSQWLPLLEANKELLSPHVIKILIANKIDEIGSLNESGTKFEIDMTHPQYVYIIAGERLASDHDLHFRQTSARYGIGILEAYDQIVKELKTLTPHAVKNKYDIVNINDSPKIQKKCFNC